MILRRQWSFGTGPLAFFTAMAMDHWLLATAAILIGGALPSVAALCRHSIKVYTDLGAVLCE
jgi:hypothetical protein